MRPPENSTLPVPSHSAAPSIDAALANGPKVKAFTLVADPDAVAAKVTVWRV
jgi:hypothetical protein